MSGEQAGQVAEVGAHQDQADALLGGQPFQMRAGRVQGRGINVQTDYFPARGDGPDHKRRVAAGAERRIHGQVSGPRVQEFANLLAQDAPVRRPWERGIGGTKGL